MSIRRLIVEIDPASINVTRFCAEHGISTWFFYELRRRHRLGGDGVLEARSRAPKPVANKTPVRVEDLIVAERKRLDDAGLDAGPASIAWSLRHEPDLPSESTIWRILRARGFITPDPSKAPDRVWRSFSADRANECWQLDDTTWALADGTEVKILNVLDDHSRLLVASTALASCAGAAVLAVLAAVAVTLGWPARVLTDNARAFKDVLVPALAELGVGASHSRPYHPQTCGKVERFHQSLKRWLAKQPPAHTLTELQTQLDWFRHHYNHHRPHRSLDRATPAATWTAAAKDGPADHPLALPTRIHHSHVTEGRVNASNQARITIGSAHNDNDALIVITGNRCHVFVHGRLARALTLEPGRRDYPTYHDHTP